MDRSTFLTCLVIFCARVGDVSLGTLRVVMVTQGRRGRAALLGFFEVLIWVFAVSAVLQHLRQIEFAVAYALGFATGNYVGLTVERWAALGHQVVRIFSRCGHEIAERLRSDGFRVTVFDAQGRDGSVSMLYTETSRRRAPVVADVARQIDPRCYYVVDDIRVASSVDTPPKRSILPWAFMRRGK